MGEEKEKCEARGPKIAIGIGITLGVIIILTIGLACFYK
jgi:hypothetical protein